MLQRAEDQMEYNRMLEKWRPGYNELQKKVHFQPHLTVNQYFALLLRGTY